MRGRWADPTVFRHEDRWWLLACATRPPNRSLHLFHADDLFGPWREHPRSPVVADDVRTARPAGRVVFIDGRPVRFAQDCTARMGRRYAPSSSWSSRRSRTPSGKSARIQSSHRPASVGTMPGCTTSMHTRSKMAAGSPALTATRISSSELGIGRTKDTKFVSFRLRARADVAPCGSRLVRLAALGFGFTRAALEPRHRCYGQPRRELLKSLVAGEFRRFFTCDAGILPGRRVRGHQGMFEWKGILKDE